MHKRLPLGAFFIFVGLCHGNTALGDGCAAEINEFCSHTSPRSGSHIPCLMENLPELSDDCLEFVDFERENGFPDFYPMEVKAAPPPTMAEEVSTLPEPPPPYSDFLKRGLEKSSIIFKND